MSEKKTFLLCVGAQKAGTTWLGQWLNQSSEVLISPMKEVHFFDVKFKRSLCKAFDKQALAALERTSEKDTELYKIRKERVNMIHSDEAYLQHYKCRDTSKTKVWGDFTPSYSLLEESDFIQVKEFLSEYEVKVIFLMRDPVDRFFSAMQMKKRALGGQGIKFDIGESLQEELADIQNQLRGDYERCVKALVKVFGDNVYFGFYESLFQKNSLDTIKAFCGIDEDIPYFDKRVNSGGEYSLDEAIAKDVFAKHKQTYDFVFEFFRGQVPKGWYDTYEKYHTCN